MDKIILQTYDLNGLSSPIKSNKNETFYINTPINNQETKYLDSNKKNFEEEKNKSDLPISFIEPKFINNNQNENYLPINTLPDKLTEGNKNSNNNSNNKSNKNNDFTYSDKSKFDEFSLDNSSKNNNILINKKQKTKYIEKNNYDKDETAINAFILDEINIKYDYEKIQNGLNKIKEEKKYDPIYIKMYKNVDDNKIINNNNHNQNNYSFPININNKNEEDLFYYSFKDKNKDNLNEKNNDVSIINKELEMETLNEKNDDKKDINKNINNSDKDINYNFDYNIKIDKDMLQKIEFAIDENGNPFNLKNYFEELKNRENQLDSNLNNNDNNLKKPIAFIMQKEEKDKNYLIDLNGNIIPKMDDGYFNYKHNNIRIIIKDFDVQHPQLRVFGTRKFEPLIISDENEKEEENDEIDKESLEIKKLIIPCQNQISIHNDYNSLNNKKVKIEDFKDKNKLNLNFNKNLLKINNNNSPIIIKNEIENNNRNKNESFSVLESIYIPITDDRERYSNENTNDLIYKKIKSHNSNLKEQTLNNFRHKNNNIDTIKRTSEILNKTLSTNFYVNRNYSITPRINSNYKILNINNSSDNKNVNNNKENIDSSNKSHYNKEDEKKINSPLQINNITCTSSKINLFNYKKLNKKAKSINFNNKFDNLESIINKREKNNKVQHLLSCDNLNNNDQNDNIYISKNESNNSKMKNSQSTINVSFTIDNISKNINYIQKNIQKNLSRINERNGIKNKANTVEHIKNNNHKKSNNSTIISHINLSNEESFHYLNFYTHNNYNDHTNIENNNSNIKNTSINYNQNNYNKIQINKDYAQTAHDKKKNKYAVLSKEVNDIISDYSNSYLTNEKINKKIGIYDYNNEFENNNHNINSFLNKANKINLKNLSKRYNNHITETDKLSININNNKSLVSDNKNNKNSDSCGYTALNKEKNIALKKEINNHYKKNKNNSTKKIKDNPHINLYSKTLTSNNNSSKSINTYSKPKINSKYNIKSFSHSNKMNIKKGINFNNDYNLYSKNSSIKKYKIDENYNMKNNNTFNYTERRYSYQKKII